MATSRVIPNVTSHNLVARVFRMVLVVVATVAAVMVMVRRSGAMAGIESISQNGAPKSLPPFLAYLLLHCILVLRV